MTVMERMSAAANATIQTIMDKETINYLEAAALYSIVAQGRHNVSSLNVLYNQAQDPDLKKLLHESIDRLTEQTIKQCEDLLKASGAKIPTIHFLERPLEDHVEIPPSARFSDMEIAVYLGNMAKTSQFALLMGLQNCYQPEIAATLRTLLVEGLDWDYKLMQLMLNRGWLPRIAKVEH